MPVTNEIDAVKFTQHIKDTYVRYLYTANSISDSEPELQKAFLDKLNKEYSVIQGPFFHCTPCYKPSLSIRELVNGQGSASLSPKLMDLPDEYFDPDRSLYSHQIKSIEHLQQERYLVVATGTGSGKTECFLFPILDSILVDPTPGLRAIIIYPMNALANDQLLRLRNLLRNMPEVTFGRYTGETPWDKPEDLGTDRLKNERMTRQEIRESPPHILLTNFAMLEYLLLRPNDSALFANQNLSYLVLDEAHSYSGAQGIEISMLMRRLRQYLHRKEKKVQFVLTSATLGNEENITEKVAQFATDLTGVEFQKEDILQGEVVDSFSKSLKEPFSISELGVLIEKTGGINGWNEVLFNPDSLWKKVEKAGFTVEKPEKFSTKKILFNLLSEYAPLAKIHDYCREKPSTVGEICNILGVEENKLTQTAITWLVTMGTHAKKSADSSPLLPMRLHFFCRGLAGATVCMNTDCPNSVTVEGQKWSKFFLEDCNTCPECEHKVLPISTCVHCGMPAHKIYIQDGKWHKMPDPVVTEQQSQILTWMDDLDEDNLAEDEEKEIDTSKQFAYLCFSCGSYNKDLSDEKCCKNSAVRKLRIVNTNIKDGNLKKCPRCGGSSGGFDSVLRNFVTFEDAPTAVLAETVMRNLPIDTENPERNNLPANGRNLLVFSDSRQRAAFFAPYLTQTTAESAYLGPLKEAIEKAEDREGRPVCYDEIANEYVRRITNLPVAVIKNKKDGEEYFDLILKKQIRSKHKSEIKKEVELALYKNFCSSKKMKTTLEGVGIATARIDFNESEKEQFCKTVPELFEKSESFGEQAILAFIDVFLTRKAIEFPDYITAKDVSRLNVGPDAFTFHYQPEGKIYNRLRYRWNPYKAPSRSKKNAIRTSRQLSILCKILKKDKLVDEGVLSSILERIWECLTDGILCETQWPGEFRLDPDCLQVTQKDINWYFCDICGRITSLGELGCCLNIDCKGTSLPVSQSELQNKFKMDHYRNRYFLPPFPLEVREHTAQLVNNIGKKYQKAFIEGKVNVLSSSTTFEMGIDVGNLKAVMLRNVPPTTSSYIQRTGRAGRRKDGISAALTFCRNLPHDQYNYQHPQVIIKGAVPAPFLNVANKPLAQRHCNSLLLGDFLKDISRSEAGSIELNESIRLYDFFLDEGFGNCLVLKFATWCREETNKRRLMKILELVIPDELKDQLNAEAAINRSIDGLCDSKKSVLQHHVLNVIERFDEQMNDLHEQLSEVTGRKRTAIAISLSSLERLKEQFVKQRLIDFLSSCSWLPGYAFPQDNVKLLVRHPEYIERMRLERDREIGISEYAPGSEVVADGKVFTSVGVWFNSKEPEIRWYARCPECRKIETGHESEPPSFECSSCGTQLRGRFTSRKYLKPDGFTTLVNDTPQFPGRFRRRPPRTSEIFLLEGAADFSDHKKIKGVSYGIKKDGKLFRANSNHKFRGFMICRKCGKSVSKPGKNAHETPWGSRCNGKILTLDMAHEIITDILQLRFQGCAVPPPDVRSEDGRIFWQSFLAAFLNGASDALGISINDLGGTYHGWTVESFVGELVIYDRIPGGAGYIPKIVEDLDKVLQEVLRRVRDCKCSDVNSSCYACLRSYSNQFYWEQLRRRPIIDWLTQILS
jgi:Lhr-like helicase